MGQIKFLTVIFVLVMIIVINPAFAGFVSIPPQPGAMYVVTGASDNTNVDGGALALVDFPGTGDLTQIGAKIADQVSRKSLPGMAFDSFGQLFVVAQGNVGPGDPRSPILLKINPSTGAIITNIGTVIDENTGNAMNSVRDLAMQNKILYGVGISSASFPAFFSINTNTAVATIIGSTTFLNGLAITPDGTFYATQFCTFQTLNPTNGDTTFVTNLGTCMDGLGADAAGNLYGTEAGPDSVHLIDISDGSDVTVGAVGDNPSDVDFFPNQISVGGTLFPIESTSLILAGAQMTASWMIPVIVSAVGIVLVFVRKSENS